MIGKYWDFTGDVIDKNGVTLRQIVAVKDFLGVKAGTVGGWISDEAFLAQNGFCWVGRGAEVYGGTIRGGTIEGGTIRGGIILGGVILGGIIWGGTIFGGSIEGGTIRGGDYITISPIGSECGEFTATVSDEGVILCNRGCFSGSLDDFERAVKETHSGSKYADEYKLVIDLVKLRLGPIAEKRKQTHLEAA